MIELDVLSERPDGSGRLLVAHDYEDMHERTPLSFEQALDHLAGEAFASLELDVDVKIPGYELRVVQGAAASAALVARTLVSGMFTDALARIRAAEPALRLGWSVPRVRRDYTTDMLTAIPALAFSHRLPRDAAAPRAQRPARGTRWRRDHGPLGASSPRGSYGLWAKAPASCTCGRSTTPRASPS